MTSSVLTSEVDRAVLGQPELLGRDRLAARLRVVEVPGELLPADVDVSSSCFLASMSSSTIQP